MSKKILITIGSVSIVLLLGVWVYLFVFGTPNNIGDALTNFRSPSTPYEQPIVSNSTSTIALGSKDLSQLSTRFVAGFKILSDSYVRYVEKGTGHIYEINLDSGTEERIDGTTTGNTTLAYFNNDASGVIIISDNGTERKVNWRATIGQSGDQSLPENSYDFTWKQDGDLFYTVKTPGQTVAHQNHNGDDTELWQIPLSDVRALFTESGDYIVNNPASRLSSGVYKISDGKLTPLINNRYALTTVTDSIGQLFLYRYFDTEEQTSLSRALNTDTKEEISSALSAVPEKCAFDSFNYLVWCASSFSFLGTDREFLNKWYRGEVTSPDKLWVSDYNDLSSATLAIDLSEEAGFYVDVVDLAVSDNGKMLLFKNKINDALWMYRLTEKTIPENSTEEETTGTSSDAF